MRRPDDDASEGEWAAYLWMWAWDKYEIEHIGEMNFAILGGMKGHGCTWQDIADVLNLPSEEMAEDWARGWARRHRVTLYRPGSAAVHAVARGQHDDIMEGWDPDWTTLDAAQRDSDVWTVVPAYPPSSTLAERLPRLSDYQRAAEANEMVQDGDVVKLKHPVTIRESV